MSSDLEDTFNCIYDGHVPPLWEKTYSSMKPLASWARDLVARVEQFSKWATTAHPPLIFSLSFFTFPTGFLTAVLQTCARQNNVSLSSLACLITFCLGPSFVRKPSQNVLQLCSSIELCKMSQKLCLICGCCGEATHTVVQFLIQLDRIGLILEWRHRISQSHESRKSEAMIVSKKHFLGSLEFDSCSQLDSKFEMVLPNIIFIVSASVRSSYVAESVNNLSCITNLIVTIINRFP